MEQTGYTALAKTLHWLIALLIFILFPLAWFMDDFSGIAKFKAYNLHKSLGITVLALMALRILWRLVRPAPSLPATMPRAERFAAHLGHFALYLMVVLMTFSGWAMISSSDKPSVLYQYTAFPRLPWLSALPAEAKKSYESFFMNVHGLLSYLLLAFIAVHIAASVRHAVVLRDGILSRMLPRFGRRDSAASMVGMILLAGLFMLVAPYHAWAMEWGVNPQRSQISFEASGSGSVTKGTFSQFKSEVEFDPDSPEEAAVRVSLNMQSATTGTSDVDVTLQSADYFNSSQFPTATFVARGAKPNGPGKFILNGQLTMKGVTKPVSLPFSITIKSGTATVIAETKINRLDFGIGPDSVAGLAIDKDVKLTLNLTAVRLDN